MTEHKLFEDRLRDEALRLGFAAVGIARADAAPRSGERLRQWLAEGRHGEMIWMEERAHHRAAPTGLWPEVKSVIALGMSYAPGRDPLALAGEGDRGRISVYAQGSDYHDLVKRTLKALARWIVAEAPGADLKVFVDTAPVMEKPLAEAAGLGWQGKHTNLVSRDHGSWLFLGAIYTTLDLVPDQAGRDRCGSCDACQRSCPTDAFPAPYRLDARRCISYLTIEHRGEIAPDLQPLIGDWLYGCDICQDVCPHNSKAPAATEPTFQPRFPTGSLDLCELEKWTPEDYRTKLRGSAMKRTKLPQLRRNAEIVRNNARTTASTPPDAIPRSMPLRAAK